jgi:apoptosis-inducing factor 1
LGPHISYEAVGVVDNTLSTYGIWAKEPSGSPDASEGLRGLCYGKGLVFYANHKKQIVGLLMFNLLGRIEMAREILAQKKSVDDIEEIVEKFKVYSD